MTPAEPKAGPRLALVSRGDPLTSYLHAALARRYPVVADIDVELRGARRAAVAAMTFRPTWPRWAGRYMKSNLGFRARSGLARRRLDELDEPFDVVVQTHALFDAGPAATVVYVDCTYLEAVRGWPAWTPLRGPAETQWLRSERRLYRRATHLFAFTARSRDSLVEDYGVDPARITIVGAGVNFRTDPSALPNASADGARTILFVGKEFERKGGPQLLDAFRRVRGEFPDVRLQIVGATPSGILPDGVDLLGEVDSRARMDELYAQADIFCLPSLFDPAPLVVLEAMGHGLPCVLSEGASAHVRTLVDDRSGGWAAPTGDATGIAEGLLTYLRDPVSAQRAGETARRAMSEAYTWDCVVDRMAPVLDALGTQRVTNRS